jgi:CheY-like chemotaxis protein
VDAVLADPAAVDLVITDFNMPGMSGLVLARRLLSARSDLPIVLRSGCITDELQSEAQALGIRSLLSKPSTLDELRRVVETTIA